MLQNQRDNNRIADKKKAPSFYARGFFHHQPKGVVGNFGGFQENQCQKDDAMIDDLF